MPNLYATPAEIKAAMPDGFQAATTKYDTLLLRLANEVSRFIDRHCRRVFLPRFEVRYLYGPAVRPFSQLWIEDLLAIDEVAVSDDGGANYTAMAATDYIATVAGDYNDRRSWSRLEIDRNGDYTFWTRGQKAIKITGWWGYADDRDAAFDDSGIDLAAGVLAASGAMSVADVTAADQWGMSPALHPGRLVRIDDELIEVVSVINATAPANDTLGVIRGRNGTTGAAHDAGDSLLIWYAPDPVRTAASIQAARLLERGLQGYGDARATAEIGQAFYLKALDPEAKALLAPYVRMAVG